MVRRVYVDSRFRDAGGNDNDFWYTLNQSLQIPESTVALIDSVHIANVIPTIIADRNDRLYFREIAAGPTITDRWVVLAEGNYDAMELAVEVAAKLNGVSVLTGTYTVTYSQSRGTLTFSNSAASPATFALWSRKELQAGAASGSPSWPAWLGGASYPLSTGDLKDACEVIGHVAGETKDTAAGQTFETPEWILLFPIRTLYLHSDNLGVPMSSIGPRGQTSIIRSIIVNASYGHYINSDLSHPWDHLDVSGQQLSSLQFSLRDVNGALIPLHGRPINFSLLFIDTP